MPLLESTYVPPPLFTNGHLQTIYAGRFRLVGGVQYVRERIDTPDDDFLDLDWVLRAEPTNRVAVLSHGLEGSTDRPYMRGMARALARRGWDVLAWNYRSCSGEPNRQPFFYHSGATYDLAHVVQHAFGRGYEAMALVGYSLGGNLTLKYLGEQGADVDARIQAAVTYSVPCSLADGAAQLEHWSRWIYMQRFLHALHGKIRAKQPHYPEVLDDADFRRIRSFRDFDDRYTAPLHGFRDAEDYWQQNSCRPFLPAIRVPTLIVNAADDPFLGTDCFPHDEARANPLLHLEIPEHGGHVGFVSFNDEEEFWSEQRAAAFLA